MGTPLPGPYAFNTRQYYDPSGDQNAPIDVELSWQQLDTTLLFLSGAIASVPTSVAEVLVGTSASLVLSSSGNITGSIQEGTVWVVAGDTAQNNGLSWIFDAGPGPGAWYPLQFQIPLPYVRLAATSSAAQVITSSLLISGSGVTFSSSLFWSGASSLNGAAGSTVMLGNDGKIYITGSYGGGGGGSGTNFVKAGAIAPSAFSGNPSSSTITFGTAMATANYGVSVIGGDARSWTIDNKTVSGFTINSNSIVALTTSASWIAAPANNP